ncbi:T9SS type A sorting domain-containing protein [Pseudotenacibaculum sp. MALMAid0570]|uniref:T9SS type A sorting domain-containing protein n=1 Tax=Pseudotenacibaculum sp. MALMAid0570 TaxID=3143938 RepID=UPI0032E02EF6
MKQAFFGLILLYSLGAFAQTTHTISVLVDQPANCQTLSTEDLEQNTFSLYPNPVKDRLNIESKSLEEIKEIVIYNIIGQKITKSLYNIRTTQTSINTKHLKKGIYFIQIRTIRRTYDYKIVIKEN